jgi:hypothetical protein
MDSFNYNNIPFYVNDTVLLKYKSRILKYIITFIYDKKDYYLVKFKNFDDDFITKTEKFKKETTNKFIKKYFIYDEPPVINCSFKHVIYKFHCNFCNKIHKHNLLGHQDYRCISIYSPYSKSGYILKLNFENFNEYLLYNLELYLLKIKFWGWSSYKLSVKKFYEGTVCKDYGKKNFPYITPASIEYIRVNFKKDNLDCSNGCLVSGLNSVMKMILSKNILHIDKTYKTDLNKLYNFYKKNCKTTKSKPNTLNKLQKIKLIRKILSTYKPKTKEIKIGKKKKTEKIEIKKELIVEKIEIKKELNVEKIEKIDIKLDLDCGMEQIETLSTIHINNIKEIIYEDLPDYKDKYFYLPNDVKLYSSYLNTYEDLWLCMYKLETDDNYTVYCVDEVDIYDPDFINYRLEIRNNKLIL